MNLLKSHLSRKHHHAPEREGQLCPICGKKCYYTADLEIHIAVQHMGLALERPPKDEGEVMCHECGKVCFIVFSRFAFQVTLSSLLRYNFDHCSQIYLDLYSYLLSKLCTELTEISHFQSHFESKKKIKGFDLLFPLFEVCSFFSKVVPNFYQLNS